MTPKNNIRTMHIAFCMSLFHIFNPAIAATGKKPVPILKLGLWEIRKTDSLAPTLITNERRCVGARKLEVLAANNQYEQDIRQCSVYDVAVSAKKIEYIMKCEPDPGVVRTFKVVYEGDFSKKFERTSTLSINIATKFEGAFQKVTHKFIGTCPKNMKPGDIMLINSAGGIITQRNQYDPKDPVNAAAGAKR